MKIYMYYSLEQACETNWGSSVIANRGMYYYKLRQLLQNREIFITN